MPFFIAYPFLSLIPAAVFALLFWVSRKRSAFVMAAIWLVYGIYEYGMHRRWLCSGECNIRVDLLLIYPALLLGSLVAGVSAVRAILRRSGGP